MQLITRNMKHYHKNPRSISDQQKADLKKWLAEYGDLSGIVVNKNTGEIIGGNQRADAMGFIQEEIKPVIEHKYSKPTKQGTIATGYFLWQGERYQYRLVSWSDKKAEQANIIANKAGGVWDWSILKNEFDAADLTSWGFTQKELEAEGWEFEDTTKDAEPQIDRAAELQKKWKTKSGQLWQLGNHRLLIGDCTVRENVERLMDGERAKLNFSDPPYGIERDEGFEGFGGFGKPIARRQYSDDWDRERPTKEHFNFMLTCADNSIFWGGNYYADILPQSTHWIVWDKNNTMPTFGDCELAWTSFERKSVKKYEITYNGLIGKEKERFHPTQKPLKLYEACLADYSKEGEAVIEFYAGSGTTIIAAHNLNRRCYAMEISPAYCAVILQRFYDAFGIMPTLLSPAKTRARK